MDFKTADLDKISLLLRGRGKKVLLYHTDPDGISSAALLLKFYSGFELVPMDGPIMDGKFLKWLISMKPDLLVVLDIPIDQEWEKIKRLQRESPGTKMVVIDHHIPEKDISSGRNVHINPRFEEDVYVPASALVYRLLRRLGKKVKPSIWIAAIGIIGDHAYEDCRDILDECRKAFPALGKEKRPPALVQASDMIMSAVVLHGIKGVAKSLEILMHASSLAGLKKDSYLSGCGKKVTAEIKRVMADYKRKRKEHPNLGLVTYRLRSKLNIASTISSMLAEREPDKIILVTKHSKNLVKISARYQAGLINLSELLKLTVAGIGFGGGHKKAAGAIVNKRDMREFERRLVARVTVLRSE